MQTNTQSSMELNIRQRTCWISRRRCCDFLQHKFKTLHQVTFRLVTTLPWVLERKKTNLIATNNNSIKQKNKETILKLARSRLPEKQQAIYAGRLHC